ncbi:MAG: hypothetical protein M3159_04775 [Actinomycetota bacterium]|nr:hypothetical protein [Actinomycetota bacterium]
MTRDPAPGAGSIGRASWWGTAVFTVTAVGADLYTAVEAPAFVVAVVLFFAGCAAFIAAYFRAVGRSRADLIAVTSLFFLSGSAPAPVRRSLLGSFAVQVVVAFATAIARPYTSLAAGTLVPVYGIALCGLWAARYGTFPPRTDPKKME